MMADFSNASLMLEQLIDGELVLGGKQFYENQITAAEEAVAHFAQGKRYVLLSAQMQSGKTGCSLYVACKMLIDGVVENVFIISGSHETVLRKQWVDEIPKHLFAYCQENGVTDDDRIREYSEKLMSNVFFRQDLAKNLDRFTEKYLILWDESHYAVQEGQQLDRFFGEVGITGAIQGDISCLEEKNSFVLSITATRGAEQSRKMGANDGQSVDCWGTVVLHPGEGYRGVEAIKAGNMIMPSVPINEEHLLEFREIIGRYAGQRKYIIVRTTEVREELIEQLLTSGDADEEPLFDIVRFNMETKSTKKKGVVPVSIDNLKKKPERLTLFLVRQMLRMGKQLPKKHICAVYEHTDKQNYDTALQSLLGRTCGYNITHNIDVYIDNGAQNKALNNYIEIVQSGFDKPVARTQNIRDRKIKEVNPDAKILFPNAPHLLRVSEDEYRLTNDTGAMNFSVQKAMAEFAQILIDRNVHTDPRYSAEQQCEISRLLNTTRSNGFQSDFTTIHSTHKASTGEVLKSIKKDKCGCMLGQLGTALETNSAIKSIRTIEKQMVIYRVNGSSELEGTGLMKGDCVVIFNTEAASEFQPPVAKSRFATNNRDAFHTQKVAKPLVGERDGDGCNKCPMPEEAKNNITVLKAFISQHIQDFIDFKDGKREFAAKNYISTESVIFDRDVYLNAGYMKGIFKSVEEKFGGRIKIDTKYGRGRGALRCEYIKWY